MASLDHSNFENSNLPASCDGRLHVFSAGCTVGVGSVVLGMTVPHGEGEDGGIKASIGCCCNFWCSRVGLDFFFCLDDCLHVFSAGVAAGSVASGMRVPHGEGEDGGRSKASI